MKQILYLKKLQEEKVLTFEEYQSAVISYFSDMNPTQYMESLFVVIASSVVWQIINNTYSLNNSEEKM